MPLAVAPKRMDDGLAVAWPLLLSATVTVAVGSLDSATVNSSSSSVRSACMVPKLSSVRRPEVADSSSPAVSLSVMVSGAPATEPSAAVPLAIAVPVTVACLLSAPSMSSSTAVMAAVSEEFEVCPAMITMVASEPTVYAPGTVATVTVTFSPLTAALSVAVTVAAPPSATDAGFTDSITVGPESLSRLVPDTDTGSRAA